jgi:hypothetical protein
MSKQKTALNSRKGGGRKSAKGASIGSRASAGSTVQTSRRRVAAMSATARKNAKASGPTPARKRHAGIGRS